MENRIRRRRKELGITQQRLALESGIGRQTVSDMERGAHEPGVGTALRLAKILRCRVEDIFREEETDEADTERNGFGWVGQERERT